MSVQTAARSGTGLRDQVRARGYAVLPRLLPDSEVARVRDAVTAVYDQHGWLAPGEHGEAGPAPDGSRRDGVPGWWRFIQDVQSLEAFHRLAHHPALTGATSAVLGSRPVNHPRRHLTPVNPGFWVPPHQEFTYIQGTPDFITAFVPLTTFAADECALRLATTFERAVRPLRRTATAGVEALLTGDVGWETVALRPGDVVLIHSLALREVTENATGALKLAAQYRYQPARTPICKASLKPEHYPRLPDWNVIAKGWRSRRWIVPPMLPRLVEYRMPPTIETWHEVFADEDLS
jgi:hypothetical protein